jgi:hypothetical protein
MHFIIMKWHRSVFFIKPPWLFRWRTSFSICQIAIVSLAYVWGTWLVENCGTWDAPQQRFTGSHFVTDTGCKSVLGCVCAENVGWSGENKVGFARSRGI